ncbi:hypothetical protein ACFPRI_09305, partial [Corynebacterium pilbarense]
QTLHKNVSAETGREKPNTQPKTNQPTPKQASDWQKSKNYKGSKPTPNPTGQKQRGSAKNT